MNPTGANDTADPRDRATPKGVRATVVAPSTNGAFRLQLAGGREVQAHAGLDLRMASTRLLPGDEVLVEPSPFDPNRARIVERLRGGRPAVPAHHIPQPVEERELS